MNTYYGVMTEFYDNGTVKAAIISRKCAALPKNASCSTPIADCYIDWYEDRAHAETALAEARKESAA